MSVLSADLKFVLVVTILGIIIIFILSSWHNEKIYRREREEKEQKQSQKNVTKQTSKNNVKNSSIIDTLDWMLAKGIIDSKEYSKLMGKCLPFL